MNDDWTAYRTLSRYGYTHDVVVHNENFFKPYKLNGSYAER